MRKQHDQLQRHPQLTHSEYRFLLPITGASISSVGQRNEKCSGSTLILGSSKTQKHQTAR